MNTFFTLEAILAKSLNAPTSLNHLILLSSSSSLIYLWSTEITLMVYQFKATSTQLQVNLRWLRTSERKLLICTLTLHLKKLKWLHWDILKNLSTLINLSFFTNYQTCHRIQLLSINRSHNSNLLRQKRYLSFIIPWLS